MSLPISFLPQSASASIPSALRGDASPTASQSGFGAIMQSLSEKGGGAKNFEGATQTVAAEGASPAKAPGAVAAPLGDARGGSVASTASAPPDFLESSLSSLTAQEAADAGSSAPASSLAPSPSGRARSATSSSAVVPTSALIASALFQSPLSPSSAQDETDAGVSAKDSTLGAGQAKPLALLDEASSANAAAQSGAALSRSDWDQDDFSAAASAMGLRVTRSAKHLGISAPSPSSGVASSRSAQPTAENAAAGKTETATAASTAAVSEASADKGGGAAFVSANESASVTPQSSSTAAPLASVPDLIAEAAASLSQPEAAPGASAAATVPSAPNAKTDGAKELDVELSPPELGSMLVKMKLSGGSLSVVIEVSSASSLSAIERERDAIVSRLSSGDHQLSSLVVKSFDPPASAVESPDTRGAVNENGSHAQQQSDQRARQRGAGASAQDSDSQSQAAPAGPAARPGHLLV